MRKLFSILLALGLVLGMVAATLPAAAQAPGDWTGFTVAVANPCEFELSNYTFTFTPTADLHSGTHSISIRFPDGTGFPEIWRDGHITVNGEDVFGTEVTRDGNDVTFLVPVDIVDAALVTVTFETVLYMGQTTGIRNPAAGLYFYFVKTSRAPNSEWVRSGWNGLRYVGTRIQPAIAAYYYDLDFGPTYPGIAADFVPPFKACGQWSNYDPDWAPGDGLDVTTPFNTYEFAPDQWASNFTLTFGPGWGCAYCRYDTSMVLTSAPSGGVVTVLGLNGPETMTMLAGQERIDLPNDGLPIDDDIEFELAIHFNAVGTYEICFEAWALDSNTCAECQNVQRCETFEVKQWKDATYIELGEKWNLMSLPIVPFDTSIGSIMAPLAHFGSGLLGQLAFRSIWHYDRCDDEWLVYGNGQTSLETIEDGKSYWVRMMTASEWDNAYGIFGLAGYWGDGIFGQMPPARLWLWGTETPMPPAGPSAYLQCEGWNMLGFRSVIDRPVGDGTGDDYLYGHTFGTHYTAVYTWDGIAWESLATTDDMFVGRGYWVYWQEQRTVNPPL